MKTISVKRAKDAAEAYVWGTLGCQKVCAYRSYATNLGGRVVSVRGIHHHRPRMVKLLVHPPSNVVALQPPGTQAFIATKKVQVNHNYHTVWAARSGAGGKRNWTVGRNQGQGQELLRGDAGRVLRFGSQETAEAAASQTGEPYFALGIGVVHPKKEVR